MKGGNMFLQKISFPVKIFAKLIPITILSFSGSVSDTRKARAQGYDLDCAVILCLAGGFPTGCGAAYSYMIDRITSTPPKPPFGFCAMGSLSNVDFPDNEDPEAFEAMMREIDEPGVIASLRSARAEVYRSHSMCSRSRDDDGYRCTNTIALNGDGSELFWGNIEGWRRGKRVTFQDFEGARHAIGDAEEYRIVKETCYNGRDSHCDYEYDWIPISSPVEDFVPASAQE